MTAYKKTLLFQQGEQQDVPSWLVGIWRRLSIEENGQRDTTTQVYWLQTHSCFGDIRIPAERPAVESFNDLTEAQAIAINQQDGFVGITRLEGDTCHWHHAMDYHESQMQADTGRLYWEDDVLVEVGPNRSYVERWQRISVGKTAAMTYSDESGWQSWLVVCGEQFIYMCNALQSAAKPEISMGHVQQGGAPWKIQLSTLPWKEGDSLWEPEEMTIDRTNQQVIQNVSGEIRRWTVKEWGNLVEQFAPTSGHSMPENIQKSTPESTPEANIDRKLFLTYS